MSPIRYPIRCALACCLLFLPGTGEVMARDAACPAYEKMLPMLNSQRIASCFGSYGVEVLKQEDQLRISSLYSLTDGGKVTRTLAVSEFVPATAADLPEDLQPAYQAIRDGASMGATLQAGGWQVDKHIRYLGELPAGDAMGCLSGWPKSMEQQELALQVYDLYVQRGDERLRFALLAELHDPRYLNLEDLRVLTETAAELTAEPPGSAGRAVEADSEARSILQKVSGLCAIPQ